jgi:putative drug exporter of the RND superfamily
MRVDAIYGALGRFSVRFRWLVVLVWIAGAIAASTQLPGLSSVTQSNNQKFLPASAASSQAADLAKPFGTSNRQPIPVVAATSSGPLTAADVAALTRLQANLATVPDVSKVVNGGRSPDGQAEQLIAMAEFTGGGNQSWATNIVDGLRAQIAKSSLPAGLHAHVAGDLAVQVDQQKASGSTSNRVQSLSVLFVILLLVFIFRSFSLAVTTVLPAGLSVAIAGPLVAEAARHGLQVSPIAQLLLIVLVIGAGTDYGLFLVFRVREELRARDHDTGGELHQGTTGTGRSVLADLARPRPAARAAIVEAVTRVGESISASALTVLAAVLTLLLASFSFYSNLAWPFAIAVAVILLAGLTLLPALLSIRLSLLAVKRSLFQAMFGRPKLIPWSIQGSGQLGVWGRVAGRIVQHPVPTLLAGVVFFGGLSFAVLGYTSGGFGGNTSPPAGSDSAAGAALLAQHFPQSSANPTNLIFRFSQPVFDDAAPLAAATADLQANHHLFTQVAGPLNPVGGVTLTPAQYQGLYAALGPADRLPATPSQASLLGGRIPAQAYELYRVTANFVSPDGRTVLFNTGLQAGDPGSTPAINAIPAVRAATTSIQHSVGATASGVAGEAPALHDISSISTSDLKLIIPIAIAAIGLLLALVLRSLVAPLYLIASVGVSYLAALGLSVLVFIKAGHSGGLVFFMPFLMFIFLLALGEDYNILVMTRIREEAHRLPLRQAVAKAVSVTGTTVTSAGLVLAGSFIVLTFAAGSGSGASQVRDIGLGIALGILMDTFLVRTLLVPSTVVLLGKWNWWPSRLHEDQPATVLTPAPTDEVEAATPQPDSV